MKRRDFLKVISNGTCAAIIAPDLLTHLFVKNYAALPVPLADCDQSARVTAVGVGPLGAGMVRMLSRNLPGITCHEVEFNADCKSPEVMVTLFPSVRKSDLLFILSSFDDDSSGSLARALGETARENGALTVGIMPDLDDIRPCFLQRQIDSAGAVDSLILVSDRSLTIPDGSFQVDAGRRASLVGHAMRHTVATISNLITEQSVIGIDFADIAAVMGSGNFGRVGVGVASGAGRGRSAAKLALERLSVQGMSSFGVTGVLTCLHWSPLLTADDIDDVVRTVHDSISESAIKIVGVITDDQLGNNVKVSVLAVRNGGTQGI